MIALQRDLFAHKPSFLEDIMSSLPGEDPDKLRWYQREAVEAIEAGFEEHRTQLLVMATGGGKTQVFSVVARNWSKGDILILAHRNELLDQARARYEKMFGGFVDVEKASYHASPRSHLVVGSVLSFHKKRREAMSPNRWGLIIIDEAHRANSHTYKEVIAYFASAKVLGVTATPDRSDEKAMGKVFDNVPYIFDIEDGIEQGYLVPIKGKRIDVKEIDLRKVSTAQGDLAIGELDEVMVKAVDPIVQATVDFAGERQVIAFFPGVRSAEYAQHKFNEKKPGSCAFICATTDTFVRKQLVRDFKEGRYQFLSNMGVAIEGFDAPATAIIAIARPTKSRALYAQMVGRGTRVLEGTVDHVAGRAGAAERRALIAASGKTHMTVLDFVGNSGKHSLQTPEDVLGGNYSEAEVAQAKKAREAGGDALQSLKEARAELKRISMAATVKAKVEARDFDPFNVFGMDMPDDERFANRFGVEPASPAQLAWFRDKGVPEVDLRGLSKRAADKLRDQFKHRVIAGLATYKQMRQLQKYGIHDKQIRFAAAREALDYISSKGWGRSGHIDPQRLVTIVGQRREAGEEG